MAPFEVCAYLPNLCAPDERDLRFASTGSNFNPLRRINPRNTQCIPPVNPAEADRLPPLKVLDLRLDLEHISANFETEHFETASNLRK